MPLKHKDVGTTLTYDEYHADDAHEGDITDVMHGSRGANLHTDSHARLHNHSLAADGSPIAVAGVPDLPATKITSLRLALARLPEGTLNYVLKGQGAGADPAYGQVAHTELTGVTADQHHAQLHKASHESGGGDALTALNASIITSGILAAARGGLAKVLSPTWTNDFILVYKTATDQWVMESKPTGADHNILSATHLDTLAASVVAGDIIFGNATPKWARLAKGADGQFLKLVSGLPAWSDPPAGADHNLLSATHPDTLAGTVVRGDILIGNATPKWARLAIGVSTRVLKSDGLDPSWGQVAHGELSGVTSDQHHAQLHKDSHVTGGDAFLLADLLDCIARIKVRKNSGASDVGARRRLNLIEGSNVTLTVADDPTDEEIDVTIASAGGGAPDPEDNIDLVEEFVGGSTEAGEIGELNWAQGGTGTMSVQTAVTNHPGIYRLASGSASGNAIWIAPSSAATNLPFLFGMDSLEVTFIMRFQQSSALKYSFGFDTDPLSTNDNRARAVFEFDPVYGVDTNFMCVTGSGTARTRTDSGVAFAVDTWFKFKIKRNADGNWEFYINDVLKATNTTNLPPTTSGCNVSVMAKTTEAVAKSCDVDFCRIKTTVSR